MGERANWVSFHLSPSSPPRQKILNRAEYSAEVGRMLFSCTRARPPRTSLPAQKLGQSESMSDTRGTVSRTPYIARYVRCGNAPESVGGCCVGVKQGRLRT